MKHTKRFFLVMLVCLFAVGGQAQNFRGGLRAGFTATQMSGDELSGFHKMGAYAGGFVNWRFMQNPRWAIQPEINFVMKGSSAFLRPDKNGNIGNKYVLTLYYLEVPALAKFSGMAGISYTFKEHYGISLRFVQTAIPVRVNDGYHSRQYLTKKQFSTEIAFSLFYQF